MSNPTVSETKSVSKILYRVYSIFENISMKFVLVICILAGALFTFWAGIYSNVFPEDYSQEIAKKVSDSFLVNILAWLGVIFVIWVVWKIVSLRSQNNEEKLQKRLHIMMIILCILLGIFLMVWIHIAHYTPVGDQYYVYSDAIEMLKGNYSTMDVGGYAFHYPYQLNMAFLYQILFTVFHTQSYRLIQYLNIISILLTIYFGYRIVKEITRVPVVQVCYMMFGFTFLPLLLYSQYVYGDVISQAMASLAIWGLMRWCNSEKMYYRVIIVGAMVIGCLLRVNFYVVLIAVSIALIYHIIKNKSWQSILLLVLCALLSLSSSVLIKAYFEKKSGIEVSRGLPLSYRLHYAMQESPDGPGTYNNDLIMDYMLIAEYDYDAFNIMHRAALKERIQEFKDHPEKIPDFYSRKLMLQWNDHTFSSAFATSWVGEKAMGDVEWSVYYGSIKRFCDGYMDRYLFVLYLSFTIGMFVFWRQKNELYHYVPLIVIIGGVLCSILIEAKGRYVMPYVILMQPYAAIGLGKMIPLVEKLGVQGKAFVGNMRKNKVR